MNEEDILEHLEENPEFWVGTDVFNDEPQGNQVVFDNALAKHARVQGTCHIGASTQ